MAGSAATLADLSVYQYQCTAESVTLAAILLQPELFLQDRKLDRETHTLLYETIIGNKDYTDFYCFESEEDTLESEHKKLENS
jgi:hypothetical protein